jgi:acetyl esterase/lipase
MSIRAELFRLLCRVVNARKLLDRQLRKPARRNGELLPGRFAADLTTRAGNQDGFAYVTVAPAETSAELGSRQHIVFLHGGAYVLEAMAPHRKAIDYLVRQHQLTVTCIDYPLAPEHAGARTLDVTEKIYLQLTQQHPHGCFVLMGDSAGAGLALALAQRLRERKATTRPGQLVLASPWLDIAMANPGIAAIAHLDPILSIDSLRLAGALYAAGAPLDLPGLSPIHGDMHDLGQVLLLVGTHELFLPDCMALHEKMARAERTIVELVVGQKMMHDWIMLPIPEARRTLDAIARFIKA